MKKRFENGALPKLCASQTRCDCADKLLWLLPLPGVASNMQHATGNRQQPQQQQQQHPICWPRVLEAAWHTNLVARRTAALNSVQ